jgi:hypothetical protein
VGGKMILSNFRKRRRAARRHSDFERAKWGLQYVKSKTLDISKGPEHKNFFSATLGAVLMGYSGSDIVSWEPGRFTGTWTGITSIDFGEFSELHDIDQGFELIISAIRNGFFDALGLLEIGFAKGKGVPQSDDVTEFLREYIQRRETHDRFIAECNKKRAQPRHHPEGLTISTAAGYKVRSSAERRIADKLFENKIVHCYEYAFYGHSKNPKIKKWVQIGLPDFAILTPSGRMVLWEHLGLSHDKGYRESWAEKRRRYAQCGFVEGENIVVTKSDSDIDAAISQIVSLYENEAVPDWEKICRQARVN